MIDRHLLFSGVADAGGIPGWIPKEQVNLNKDYLLLPL
jgi:hypothetical protein